MKRIFGFKQKKWYGLKRGVRQYSEILLVLSSYDDPPTKEEFYHHDVPIDSSPEDHVVELKLVTKKVIE